MLNRVVAATAFVVLGFFTLSTPAVAQYGGEAPAPTDVLSETETAPAPTDPDVLGETVAAPESDGGPLAATGGRAAVGAAGLTLLGSAFFLKRRLADQV